MSAYLLISRTAALSASALNASRTSGAADIEKGSEAVRSIADIQKEVKVSVTTAPVVTIRVPRKLA
jgi:hypothetical protein